VDGSGRLIAPPIARDAIVAAARDWIDTPYRHQASEKGVGADCLGLVRGVWRDLYGEEPETAPPYSPDWAECGAAETRRDAARRHLEQISLGATAAGDVLLFRVRPGAPAKHVAILSAPSRIIHAYWGRAVTETALTPWWARRRAFAFSFPNVID
jgi:NlpC/P60 family putative phage cell wall peptidase